MFRQSSLINQVALPIGQRERLREGVFRPSHALPTMSVEQWGEVELQVCVVPRGVGWACLGWGTIRDGVQSLVGDSSLGSGAVCICAVE